MKKETLAWNDERGIIILKNYILSRVKNRNVDGSKKGMKGRVKFPTSSFFFLDTNSRIFAEERNSWIRRGR